MRETASERAFICRFYSRLGALNAKGFAFPSGFSLPICIADLGQGRSGAHGVSCNQVENREAYLSGVPRAV